MASSSVLVAVSTNTGMSEDNFTEEFDDTSTFENKAGLAEVNNIWPAWYSVLFVVGYEVPSLEPRAVWRHLPGGGDQGARVWGQGCAGSSQQVRGGTGCLVIPATFYRVFKKMLFETPNKQREPPVKESKLKAFIKRGSEPLMGIQIAQQVEIFLNTNMKFT